MSASDSDGSIDWLASDDEDKDSLLELDCEQATVGRTLPLPAPSGGSRCGPLKIGCTSGTKEREGGAAGFPGCNTPSGYAKPQGGEGGCQPGRSGSPSVPLPHSSGSLACEEPRQAAKRHRSSTAPECREHPWVEEAEGEKLFAHKCLELQCYIPPLSSILNGLRSGRYRERLSSFQESVAMDRIQRIMGVLQNRGMGQRHIGIILKVEDMLKNWFPNVQPKDQPTSHQTEKTLSAKKQKLSPVTTALPIQVTSASSLSALSLNTGALRANMVTQPRAFSSTNLKWLHTSPISSPVVDLPVGRLWSREKDVTQDNAVSSSTDAAGDNPPPRPPLGKISAPCLERLLRSTESIVACKGEHRDSKENS